MVGGACVGERAAARRDRLKGSESASQRVWRAECSLDV